MLDPAGLDALVTIVAALCGALATAENNKIDSRITPRLPRLMTKIRVRFDMYASIIAYYTAIARLRNLCYHGTEGLL